MGYLTVTWVEPDDPDDTSFSSLSAATRRGGFLTRDELVARYEERSGRSVSALNWYQALALWKAAVFMEGNYKRFSLRRLRRRVPGAPSTRACPRWPRRRARSRCS